jgi:autoinducer 2-degrading protein
MYRSLWLLFSIALPVLGFAQAARADEASDTAVSVVAYIEVMPSSQGEAIALLKQYREASRKEEGNVRLEVLQQSGRPEHFALVEMWKDQQAFEAHGTAAHTTQWRAKLQPFRVSPVDERLHKGLAMGPMLTAHAAGATYVVTHADAIPPGKDEALALLKSLAEASRKDGGNVRFEVLQQSSRQNHCTLVEIWQDQQALEAHVMAAHTRQFREKFQPLSGSLYDERLYKALD